MKLQFGEERMGFEVRISFFDPIDIKVKSAFSGGGAAMAQRYGAKENTEPS